LLSTALASLIADHPEAAKVAGPAAADLTRLARSPYDIWRDIFSTNAEEIDLVLNDAIARLQTLRENLQVEPDMQAIFGRAAQAASQLRQS
jgi:prephenate dehydrogenase